FPGRPRDLTNLWSQWLHCEASLACLPLHPAVAYLFLVRPVAPCLREPSQFLQVASERWTPFAWYLATGRRSAGCNRAIGMDDYPSRRTPRPNETMQRPNRSLGFSLPNWALRTRRYCFDIARAFATA